MSDQLYYEAGYIEPSFFVYIADVAVELPVEAQQVAVPSKITQGKAALAAAFTPSIRIVLTMLGAIQMMVAVSLGATANVIKSTNIALQTRIALSLQGIRIANAASTLTSRIQLLARPLRIMPLTLQLNSAFAVSAALYKLTIQWVWVIPRENRLYAIQPETRSYTIDPEIRTYKVQ